MSVKYNVVQRVNPRDVEGPRKFYPAIVSTSKLTQPEVSKEAALISSMSAGDTSNALDSILTVIKKELAKGNIIDLGEFGSFWLKTESKGSETEEAVNASNIVRVSVQFRPGKELKEMLNDIQFVKA